MPRASKVWVAFNGDKQILGCFTVKKELCDWLFREESKGAAWIAAYADGCIRPTVPVWTVSAFLEALE